MGLKGLGRACPVPLAVPVPQSGWSGWHWPLGIVLAFADADYAPCFACCLTLESSLT